MVKRQERLAGIRLASWVGEFENTNNPQPRQPKEEQLPEGLSS
jgi:hypothetical protein